MSQRYQTQYIVRPSSYGSGTNCGSSNYCPDTGGPSLLRLDDQSDLSELHSPGGERTPSNDDIEAYAKAGGDLLVVRDVNDRLKSLHGKIVALIVYATIPSFNGKIVLITGTFYHRMHEDVALADFVAQAMRTLSGLNTEPYTLNKLLAPRRRSFSALDLVERMDEVCEAQLNIPGIEG